MSRNWRGTDFAEKAFYLIRRAYRHTEPDPAAHIRVLREAYNAGREHERRSIVAYLRQDGWHPSWLGSRLGIAHQLEDGKHEPSTSEPSSTGDEK